MDTPLPGLHFQPVMRVKYAEFHIREYGTGRLRIHTLSLTLGFRNTLLKASYKERFKSAAMI